MVDSITPASDPAFLDGLATELGVRDEAAVQRESFLQWVIEDVGRPLGPDLAAAGATLTGDVAAWERAKLRLLNGPHSTLAYAGLLRGHQSVADAMADGPLAAFVEAMMRDEIAPTCGDTPGLDLGGYIGDVLQRFRNPVIVHRLIQIAQDGSQKLPYRLVDTLREARGAGRLPHRVLTALGCWLAFLMRQARNGTALVDPAGAVLAGIARDGDGQAVLRRIADAGLLLDPDLARDETITCAIGTAADRAMASDWAELR